MNADNPWPEDPSVLTDEARLQLRHLSLAAIREVAEVAFEKDFGTHLRVYGVDHALCVKARLLAFEALRIPYRLVTREEYDRMLDELPPIKAVPAEAAS